MRRQVPILVVAGVPAELVLRVLVFVLLPLWFLAVYALLTAAAPWLLQLHARFGMRVSILLAATVALLDLTRHITGRIEFGWPNMLLLYALAQQLGFSYRDGVLLKVRGRWLLLWSIGGAIRPDCRDGLADLAHIYGRTSGRALQHDSSRHPAPLPAAPPGAHRGVAAPVRAAAIAASESGTSPQCRPAHP